jgi:hypothetical protein
MLKSVAAIFICMGLILAAPAFAVDGQILINQSTVMASGGFPYKITQPGSYKLSGNLVVPANTDGIDITTSDVSIDLNGFKISGPVTCTGYGSGISCNPSFISSNGINAVYNATALLSDITVRNGFVTGFGTGVGLNSNDSLIEEIHVTSNVSGIYMGSGVVRRNIASRNLAAGINAWNATVVDNSAQNNGGAGLNGIRITYGGNVFVGNGTSHPTVGVAVSHGNNLCDDVAC